MINLQWIKDMHGGIDSDASKVGKVRPFLFGESMPYYYASAYICPECKNMMLYKMRARGATTMFKGQMINVFNVFTCPNCRRFYASAATSDGTLYHTSLPLDKYALVSKTYMKDDDYVDAINHTLQYANG